MTRYKPGFWDGIGELIAAIVIELPLAMLFGGRALWEEPPLVIAAWIGGFALFFWIVIRVARADSSAFDDFRRADRAARERRFGRMAGTTTP